MPIRRAKQAPAPGVSEEHLRLLLDHMPVMVDAFDAAGQIVIWNQECERVTGYWAEEIVGNPRAMELLYPDPAYRERMLGEWRRRGNDYREWEWELTTKDGQVRTIAWSNLSARFPVPGLTTWGIGVDVTERHRVQRNLALLAEAGHLLATSLDYQATLQQVARLAVPALADWCTVWLIQAEGMVRPVAGVHRDPGQQPLLRALHDFAPDPANPYSGVGRVLRSGGPDLVETIDDASLAGAARDDEHRRLLRALGPRSHLMVPLAARGRMLGVLALVMAGSGRRYELADLTLAEELASHAALAIDNARLHAAERQALAAAQAASRWREELLAIASHELKTPLTTIKGYVQLLGRQLAQPAPDLTRLGTLQSALLGQVDRLEVLVADLLDLARIQQGRLDLRRQPVDLVELARQVLARFEEAPERTPAHYLTLAALAPVVGHWDADRLDQVLTNLISNALKYSPQGGRVAVELTLADGQAEIQVSDEGLGIPLDQQAQLFQPFARSKHGGRSIQGVGLGLYISAQIVARHGGTIGLRSAPGAGSTFTVRLPLAAPAGPAHPEP